VALSRLGTFGLLWLLLALVAAIVWRRAEVLLLTAAAVVVADTFAAVLKQVVERPRPYLPFPEPEPLVGTALGYAFPSGHAATSFAAATVLSRAGPRLAPALFALAVAIAWSRVYVGVHYPSDILAGALLGVLVGGTLALVAGRALARPGADGENRARDEGRARPEYGAARDPSHRR
jgi:undecaprenyl-diphosphatase